MTKVELFSSKTEGESMKKVEIILALKDLGVKEIWLGGTYINLQGKDKDGAFDVTIEEREFDDMLLSRSN